VSFRKKDTLGRGGGHGDREKAGTGAEEKVRWGGAGFSWSLGLWGVQWGRSRENAPEGAGEREGRDVRG